MCLCSTVAFPSLFPVASISVASESSPSSTGFANGGRALAAHRVKSLQLQRAFLHMFSGDLVEPEALPR